MGLALAPNLVTRWRHLHLFQICPPDGATKNQVCFNSIIKLWRRPGNLHWFQYWPLDHLQMFSNWSPGFATGIATLSWIVLLVLLVGIELVSSSTRVTSVKSAKPLVLSEFQTTGPIDRTRDTWVR